MKTITEGVAELRDQYPVTAALGWDFDGFRVWVETNEPALVRELDDYFSDFRRIEAESLDDARAGGELTRITALQAEPPDFGAYRTMTLGEYKPSVKGPNEAFFDVADGRAVHKLHTRMWFLFGQDEHLTIGPCTDNPNQVINFVNSRKIQSSVRAGALLGRAAAVCGRVESGVEAEGQAAPLPRGIAIAGRAGMGRSTLALHLMNDRRVDFLSSERVTIRPANEHGTIELEGLPKHPRIDPGTILDNPDLAGLLGDDERQQYQAMPSDELRQLERKYDGLIRTCYPDQRFVLRARLVGLVLLNWTHDGGETVARRVALRQRTDLLPALIERPGLFYLGSGKREARGLPRYVEALAGVDVVELAGGIDLEAGRRAALELLGL